MKLPILLAVIALAAMTGCNVLSMTNDEIIQETKKCKDAGMQATHIRNSDGTTWKIECVEVKP